MGPINETPQDELALEALAKSRMARFIFFNFMLAQVVGLMAIILRALGVTSFG